MVAGLPPQQALVAFLISAIRSSITHHALPLGRSLHAHILKRGFVGETSLSNHLLNIYCKLSSSLVDAKKLFDEMPNRDLLSFSMLISAESRSGDPVLALRLTARLRVHGLVPNQFVFSSLVVASSRLNAASLGKQVHAQAVVSDLDSDLYVKASLIDMYAKIGDIASAVSAFHCCSVYDPVVFNSMLSGFVGFGCYTEVLGLFREARRHFGFKPTEFSFGSLIKACGYLGREFGEAIHGLIVKSGLDSNCFVGTSLVDMYGRLEDTDGLEMAFCSVSSADLALYNAVLVGLSQNDQHRIALQYFRELILEGFKSNECTFSTILKSCGGMKSLTFGRLIHGFVEKFDFRHNLVVSTALTDMYMKCGMIEQSVILFDSMNQRNTVSYNSMISGYIQNGNPNEAMFLFIEMKHQKLECDLATFVTLMSLSMGYQWAVYVHAIKCGFGLHSMVENALLDSLFKNGDFEVALKVFNKMKERNVISWTTAISGFTQLEYHSKAIELFKSMSSDGASPNRFTFSATLKACGSLANLEQGRCIHGCGLKHGAIDDEFTSSSLLDMYAKCGALEDCRRLFDDLPRKDIVSWNTMISGYAHNGKGNEALELYFKLEKNGIEPNNVTFLSILSACSHCGLVDGGIKIFEMMLTKYKVVPLSEHYACMVDLFGRAGMLDKAKRFIESMPFKADASIWTVFLSACKLHGNVTLARLARDHIIGLEGENNPTFVLMSNMYSGAGQWDAAESVRKGMRATRVSKNPGVSWMQVLRSPEYPEQFV